MAAEPSPASPLATAASEDDGGQGSPVTLPALQSNRGTSESFLQKLLGMCHSPETARDLDLDGPPEVDDDLHRMPGGHKRWQQDLARMHEYVSGMGASMDGRLKVYHQKVQETLSAQEKRHAEELMELRVHLVSLGTSADKMKLATEAESSRVNDLLVQIQREIGMMQEELREIRANEGPDPVLVAELEAVKQRVQDDVNDLVSKHGETTSAQANSMSEVMKQLDYIHEKHESIETGMMKALSDEIGFVKKAHGSDIEDLKGRMTRVEPKVVEMKKALADEIEVRKQVHGTDIEDLKQRMITVEPQLVEVKRIFNDEIAVRHQVHGNDIEELKKRTATVEPEIEKVRTALASEVAWNRQVRSADIDFIKKRLTEVEPELVAVKKTLADEVALNSQVRGTDMEVLRQRLTVVEPELVEVKKTLADEIALNKKARGTDIEELKQRLTAVEPDIAEVKKSLADEIVSNKDVKQRLAAVEPEFVSLKSKLMEECARLDGEVDNVKATGQEFKKVKALAMEVRARALLLPDSEEEVVEMKKKYAGFVEDGELVDNRAKETDAAHVDPAAAVASDAKAATEEQTAARKERLERSRELLAKDETVMKQDLMMALLRKEVTVARAEIKDITVATESLEKSFLSLREDLHREVEATAIKAGYLSVALTDCDQNERRRIHVMLQQREKEMKTGTDGMMMYSAAVSTQGMDGFGETVKTVEQNFEVELDKTTGQDLGLEVDNSSGIFLKVVSLKHGSGLIQIYNSQCLPPQVPVMAGDKIVAVNSIRGYSKLLEKELQNKKVHKIIFQRSSV